MMRQFIYFISMQIARKATCPMCRGHMADCSCHLDFDPKKRKRA